MAWFADLSPYDEQPKLRAVGWLTRGESFATGEVSAEWFEKLCELLQNPWGPGPVPAGAHACDLCQFSDGAPSSFGQYKISGWSASELYVPADGFLYIAPVSIAHYIDAHGYLPPEEFQIAVTNCPSMRSLEYLKAVLDNGGREFVKHQKTSLTSSSGS